jgi:copper chaperone CopZ
MKQTLLLIMTALLMVVGGKELRQLVLTPDPIMHCQSCEDKIKGELRFEKGVVKIETDREHQTVTITYDPKKTNVEKLQAAMKKIGRDTKVVSDKPVVKDKKQKK